MWKLPWASSEGNTQESNRGLHSPTAPALLTVQAATKSDLPADVTRALDSECTRLSSSEVDHGSRKKSARVIHMPSVLRGQMARGQVGTATIHVVCYISFPFLEDLRSSPQVLGTLQSQEIANGYTRTILFLARHVSHACCVLPHLSRPRLPWGSRKLLDPSRDTLPRNPRTVRTNLFPRQLLVKFY